MTLLDRSGRWGLPSGAFNFWNFENISFIKEVMAVLVARNGAIYWKSLVVHTCSGHVPEYGPVFECFVHLFGCNLVIHQAF